MAWEILLDPSARPVERPQQAGHLDVADRDTAARPALQAAPRPNQQGVRCLPERLGRTPREAIQLPVNDPLMLVSAMAAVTKGLGFGEGDRLPDRHPARALRGMGAAPGQAADSSAFRKVQSFRDRPGFWKILPVSTR